MSKRAKEQTSKRANVQKVLSLSLSLGLILFSDDMSLFSFFLFLLLFLFPLFFLFPLSFLFHSSFFTLLSSFFFLVLSADFFYSSLFWCVSTVKLSVVPSCLFFLVSIFNLIPRLKLHLRFPLCRREGLRREIPQETHSHRNPPGLSSG